MYDMLRTAVVIWDTIYTDSQFRFNYCYNNGVCLFAPCIQKSFIYLS